MHFSKTIERLPMKSFSNNMLLLILSLTFLLTLGCKNKKKDSQEQSVVKLLQSSHLNAIPKNAGYVIRMNARNIAEKGNLKTINELKAFQEIFVDYAEGIQYKALISLLKQPDNYGLDGENDIYVFADSEDSTKNYVGFSIKVSDSSKVENFHKKLSPTSDITTEKGFTLGSSDIGFWGWNRNLFLYITNIGSGKVDLKDVLMQSINQKEGLAQNENFKEFMKKNSDISVWIASSYLYLPFTKYTASYEAEKNELVEWLQLLFPEEEIDLEKLFQDNYIHNYSTFEEGRVICSFRAYRNKQIDRMIKKYDFWNPKGISEEALAPFPADSLYFLLYSSIDMDKIRQIANTIEKKYENTSFKKNWFVSLWRDKEGKKAGEELGGDMAISLSGIQKFKYISFPSITVTLSLKDSTFFNKEIQQQIDSGKCIIKNGYYTIPTSLGSLEFHVKMQGNTLIITSNESHIKNGLSKKIVQTYWGKRMINQSAGCFINLNYDEYPQEYVRTVSQSKKDSVYLNNFIPDKLVFTTKNYESGFCDATLKKKDENALSQFIKYSDTATYISEIVEEFTKEK